MGRGECCLPPPFHPTAPSAPPPPAPTPLNLRPRKLPARVSIPRRFFVLLDSGDLLDFSGPSLESVGGLTRVQDCRSVSSLPPSDGPSGCPGLLLTRGEDGKSEAIACSDKDDAPAFRDVWEPMLRCYPGTSSDPRSPQDAASTAMAVLLGALAHDADSTRALIRSDKIAQVRARVHCPPPPSPFGHPRGWQPPPLSPHMAQRPILTLHSRTLLASPW